MPTVPNDEHDEFAEWQNELSASTATEIRRRAARALWWLRGLRMTGVFLAVVAGRVAVDAVPGQVSVVAAIGGAGAGCYIWAEWCAWSIEREWFK